MNLDALQKRLLATARKNPPSDRVPYAFEKRILARLASARAPRPDEWLACVRALWYGAAVCVAVTLLVGVWSFASASTPGPDAGLSFSQDLEQAIFDSVDEGDANW